MLKAGVEKLFKMREEASRKRPGADEGFDPHEKPFLDHLEDLRHMLVKIGATLAIATIACFAFHKQIFKLIQLPATMPLANVSEGVTLLERLDLITLSPPEFIVLMLKLSFFSGVIITFPFLLYFIFQFILPGLRQAEKRAVIPGAAVGFILFLVGVAFAFFLAAPVALKFFYVFENERISNLDPTERAMEKSIAEIPLIGLDGTKYPPAKEDAEAEESGSSAETLTPAMRDEVRNMIRESFATIEASNIALRYDDTRGKLVIVESKGGRSIYRIGEYITFIARLVLVFGISFQLPVVVSILVKLELLTARVMRSTRTYAWIIIMVAAAILTPPDLMTLGLLAGPMIFLYEVCILIASIMERAREKRERAEEEAKKTRLEKLYSKPAEDLTEEEKEEIHRAEIEQYEREHAHLYEEESDHGGDGVERGSLHGSADPYHDYDPHREDFADEHGHSSGDDSTGDVHDESWHEDGHYYHDGHEEVHEPVQDWPDRESDGMESDHAEPVDLEPDGGEDDSKKEDASEERDGEQEGKKEEGSEAPVEEVEPIDEDDAFRDDDTCAPSGPIVDLNHATKEELMSLPGIGPALAEAIMDHRPFETFDDVESIPGIGPEKLYAMIDRLMLG